MAGLPSYFIKRAVTSVISVLAIISFLFFLLHLLPGDPILILFRNPALTHAQIENLRREFGLDKPLWEQYFLYLGNVFRGNFGISFYFREPVRLVIFPALLNSLILLIPATVVAIVLGIFTGVISAWHRGKKTDFASLGSALALYSMPPFWLGSIFIVIAVTYAHGLIPVSGMYSVGALNQGLLTKTIDVLAHMFLPFVTLTLILYGQFTIIMRNSLINVFSEDYMITAKAKGAKSRRLIWKHAYPNGLLPMISIIAINLGIVVAGAILTETVFSWPGIGYMIYEAIISRDYPLLQGAFLIISITVVVANLVADILYGYLDPRVRLR